MTAAAVTLARAIEMAREAVQIWERDDRPVDEAEHAAAVALLADAAERAQKLEAAAVAYKDAFECAQPNSIYADEWIRDAFFALLVPQEGGAR